MIKPQTLATTLPNHVSHDALLCAVIDEIREIGTHRLTPDGQRWLAYLGRKTGDKRIGRLINASPHQSAEQILRRARDRGKGSGGNALSFLQWILSAQNGILPYGPSAPNNVVFRLRMLLKRADDAPAMTASTGEVIRWLSSSEISTDDLDFIQKDADSWGNSRR